MRLQWILFRIHLIYLKAFYSKDKISQFDTFQLQKQRLSAPARILLSKVLIHLLHILFDLKFIVNKQILDDLYTF